MGIRFYRAYTPGTRNRSVSDFAEITVGAPEKRLTCSMTRSSGRNNRGVITSRHRGGGHKKLYRRIDFHRSKVGIDAKVATIEYDPNRNARIALLHYRDGAKGYILYPRGLRVGETILSDVTAPILVGNALPVSNMPLGTEIHNIEVHPGVGGQLVRAAGWGGAIGRQGGGLCDDSSSLGRGTIDTEGVLGHGGTGWQCRCEQSSCWEGGAATMAVDVDQR